MAFSLVPLQVIAFSIASVLITELAQWVFVYRTSQFQSLKANLEKHSQKVDAAKETQLQVVKNVKKREARLQSWREEAAKSVAAINLRTGFITAVFVMVTFKLMGTFFGGLGPVVQLPFEPPALLQKITQRNLENAGPRDASAFFVFVLCQGCIRPMLNNLLGLGMTRDMSDILPKVPKFGGMANKDL